MRGTREGGLRATVWWVLFLGLLIVLNQTRGIGLDGDQARNLVIQNEDAISNAISLYRGDRGRFPRTFAELSESPFMCVRAGDLINPYTGRPLEIVDQLTAGDLIWEYRANEGRLIFTSALRAPPDDRLLPVVLEYREDQFAGISVEPKLVEVEGAGPEVHRTRACADYLTELVASYEMNNGRVPANISELASQHPLVNKMWNAFQARYAIERSASDPAPGDFHYEVCTDLETGNQTAEVTFFLADGEVVRDGHCSRDPTW